MSAVKPGQWGSSIEWFLWLCAGVCFAISTLGGSKVGGVMALLCGCFAGLSLHCIDAHEPANLNDNAPSASGVNDNEDDA